MEGQTGKTAAMQGRDESMSRCIENCLDCYRICSETISHCLGKGGQHIEVNHITLMQSCIRICQTSAELMLLGTEAHVHTCRACAEICQMCADDCGRMSGDDMMRRCSEACRRCAESCRAMSSH